MLSFIIAYDAPTPSISNGKCMPTSLLISVLKIQELRIAQQVTDTDLKFGDAIGSKYNFASKKSMKIDSILYILNIDFNLHILISDVYYSFETSNMKNIPFPHLTQSY